MSHGPTRLSAADTLDREYLVIRAKLLEVAAAIDRMDRGEGSVAGDHRLTEIRQALQILSGSSSQRAADIQHVFSLPYDESWRQRFDV